MFRASMIVLVAACTATQPLELNASLGSANPPTCEAPDYECPSGWYPSWELNDGCSCVRSDWPPDTDGSRDVAAECPIADGVYSVAWDHTSDTFRPAFAVTKELIIAGNTMNLNYTTSSGQRTLDYDYPIIWVDASEAFIDGGDRTISFEIHGDCPTGVHGEYTVNLPFQNPAGQVQTYALIAVPK